MSHAGAGFADAPCPIDSCRRRARDRDPRHPDLEPTEPHVLREFDARTLLDDLHLSPGTTL
jgi:hypothetical protein